jgi:hypothetical protein
VERDSTDLNANGLALDSHFVTMSRNTSSGPMQEGMISSSPAAFARMVSGELPMLALQSMRIRHRTRCIATL